MRRLGYLAVDRIVAHFQEVGDGPALRTGEPAALHAALGGPAPEEPSDPEAALGMLFDEVLPYMQHPDHPRFFARIGSPSNFVSVLADAVAAGTNAIAASWLGGSGPSAVELVVLDWLRTAVGMPNGTSGILVS